MKKNVPCALDPSKAVVEIIHIVSLFLSHSLLLSRSLSLSYSLGLSPSLSLSLSVSRYTSIFFSFTVFVPQPHTILKSHYLSIFFNLHYFLFLFIYLSFLASPTFISLHRSLSAYSHPSNDVLIILTLNLH